MVLLIGFTLLVVLLLIAMPYKAKQQRSHELLFSSPLLVRALSGNMHTLVADWFWLLSNTIGELSKSSDSVEDDELFKATKSIATLDPYFKHPTLYAATFFSSIQEDLNRSNGVLRYARTLNNQEFQYYFLEILNAITYADEYAYAYDMSELIALSKKAFALPDSQKYIGRMSVKDFIEDIVAFSLNKKLQAIRKKEDLKWLLEQTQDPKQKARIEKKLRDYAK